MKKYLGLFFLALSSTEILAELPSPGDTAVRTHQIDVSEQLTLLHAQISLLQDIGYVVDDVNASLGYIKASKRAIYDLSFTDIAKSVFGAMPAYQIVSVSITSRRLSKETFELKTNFAYELWGISTGGGVARLVLMREVPVDDADIYRTFFRKLSKSIDLEKLSR